MRQRQTHACPSVWAALGSQFEFWLLAEPRPNLTDRYWKNRSFNMRLLNDGFVPRCGVPLLSALDLTYAVTMQFGERPDRPRSAVPLRGSRIGCVHNGAWAVSKIGDQRGAIHALV